MDRGPFKIVFLVAIAAFAAEMLVMFFLAESASSPNSLLFLDPVLLVLILSPALYLIVYKPVRKQLETQQQLVVEKEKLLAELKDYIAEVASLKEMLLVCTSCQRVRLEDGSWHRMDVGQAEATRAKFSKGLCVECMKEKYPGGEDLIKSRKIKQ